MSFDRTEIRHKIREFLKEKGRSRGKSIADHVIFQGIGSEKTVYREIKEMTNSGELKKIERNRAFIEYELIKFSRSLENRIKNLVYGLNNLEENLAGFESNFKPSNFYLQRLYILVSYCRQLQTIETLLHIYENSEAMRKSILFKEQKKRVEKFWKILRNLVFSQPDENFTNEFFQNFILKTYGTFSVVQK